ncbi:hypothetical protein GBA52_021137 [Prunus armeniaca]|nr:hypothetical protein GBA52_021137 [Prunus armeniaca]
MGATYGVSHSGQLKILEVANSLEGLDPNAVSRKKLDELIGFRDWLRYLLLAESHHISAIDELYFLDFFDVHGKVPLQLNYNQLVKKLTNHHLLFSPSSRVSNDKPLRVSLSMMVKLAPSPAMGPLFHSDPCNSLSLPSPTTTANSNRKNKNLYYNIFYLAGTKTKKFCSPHHH